MGRQVQYVSVRSHLRASVSMKEWGLLKRSGSPIALGSWLLAQVAYQALWKDARQREWFKRIKRRRGASIARVAVMRKLATVIWHMLTKRKTYAECRALSAA